MEERSKKLIHIHVAVLLFGLSGLFGKLISLPAITIVFGRVLFSSVFLLLMMSYLKKDIKLEQKSHYGYFIIMGLILAIHWTAFFKSIQVSTVAIGLLTFSTFPVFVTFLEPYFFKEKIKLLDVIIALITFSGVILVIPKFQLSENLTQGVLWGMISGFTYAVLSVLNRKYVKQYSSLLIAFYQQGIAAIVLLPLLILDKPNFQIKDILLLLLLGIVFTAISHSLFINGLKDIKVQTASIISSLEPVYGIVFAIFLLREIPSLREVLGAIIILGTAFYSTMKSQ